MVGVRVCEQARICCAMCIVRRVLLLAMRSPQPYGNVWSFGRKWQLLAVVCVQGRGLAQATIASLVRTNIGT